MSPPGAIFKQKIHQNAFVAGALSQTKLRELTALPRPQAGFQVCHFVAGEGGRKGKGRGEGRERERKMSIASHLSYSLSTE